MVKILNFFIIGPGNLKFWLCKDYGVLITYQLKNFGLGPLFGPPGAPKGQNFEIFVFQRRTFKILLYTDFAALISYQLKYFGLGPWFGPRGPRKGKILKFLFLNVGPSKFYCILILVP